MADRDKVIKGMEACTHSTCQFMECPYFSFGCMTKLAKDALELLKAQEPTAAEEQAKRCSGCKSNVADSMYQNDSCECWEAKKEEPAKRCGSCKWLRDPEFTRVCVNGDSPNVADFMDLDDSCECWEAQKEEAGK